MEDPDPNLYPADEDRDQDQDQGPSDEHEPEDLSRHVTAPRLRVTPPAELAEWADRIVRTMLGVVWKPLDRVTPANPRAEGAVWGDMDAAMRMVEPAAEALGRLGDLDLIDYQRAEAILKSAVLPAEYLDTLAGDIGAAKGAAFREQFLAGWNSGATEGGEVPAELRPALDAWHPPCALPRRGSRRTACRVALDPGRPRTTCR